MNRLALRCAGALSRRTALVRSAVIPAGSMVARRFANGMGSVGSAQALEESAVSNLLYNFPTATGTNSERHIMTALVSNQPGVLARMSGVLSARGFNIDSLVVAATEINEISRVTLVMDADQVEQVQKNLEDMVQVWAVIVFGPQDKVIERELMLCKINLNLGTGQEADDMPSIFAGAEASAPRDASTEIFLQSLAARQGLVELTKLFGGKVLDIHSNHMTVELSAKSDRVDAFLRLVRPYGIMELARSGPMAMLRGFQTGLEGRKEVTSSAPEVSDADLPPG